MPNHRLTGPIALEVETDHAQTRSIEFFDERAEMVINDSKRLEYEIAQRRKSATEVMPPRKLNRHERRAQAARSRK